MKDMENVEKRLQEIQGRVDEMLAAKADYDTTLHISKNDLDEMGRAVHRVDRAREAVEEFARQDIPFLLEQVKSKDGRIAELEDGLRDLTDISETYVDDSAFRAHFSASFTEMKRRTEAARNLLTKEGKV